MKGTPGVIYTRWGRTECPSGTTDLYEGFVGGAWYSRNSGVSNYLCLPNSPKYVQTEEIIILSSIYSAEYKTFASTIFGSDIHDYDIPCVVCLAPRTTSVMVPGTPDCPNSLTIEYSGYLMSSASNARDHSTDVICVDSNPETMLGSEEDTNGATLYIVGADCTESFMPCGPYKHDVPLSCAVCSY